MDVLRACLLETQKGVLSLTTQAHLLRTNSVAMPSVADIEEMVNAIKHSYAISREVMTKRGNRTYVEAEMARLEFYFFSYQRALASCQWLTRDPNVLTSAAQLLAAMSQFLALLVDVFDQAQSKRCDSDAIDAKLANLHSWIHQIVLATHLYLDAQQ